MGWLGAATAGDQEKRCRGTHCTKRTSHSWTLSCMANHDLKLPRWQLIMLLIFFNKSLFVLEVQLTFHILIGVVLQAQHLYRSEFLVNTFHAMGFGSSYIEVLGFEKNAVDLAVSDMLVDDMDLLDIGQC